ncbi:MAG: DEAD/DEAH box helicase family protein [Pseudomonadales bacterium]|nr:DEAD/DEAH box helicase family protein [Pseudomonadales bacterium]
MKHNLDSLRKWQAEAVSAALDAYRSGKPHFLCLATPGAGKTYMASVVANTLLESGEVDLVFCFAPFNNVIASFRSTLESVTARRFDGKVGAAGSAYTYQSMLNLDETFWELLEEYRVFVVFDEIHHCSGEELLSANAWGKKIISCIQGKAAYTLALTGTPWRSDKVPITLSSYSKSGKVSCDYSYGLNQAILDGVCRIPRIVSIDNKTITLSSGSRVDKFSSIRDFLENSDCAYQQLLENEAIIKYFIKVSSKKLDKIREDQNDAGGLFVAATVHHAYKIANLLFEVTGEHYPIVTYRHENAQAAIDEFRESRSKWIISVGMISEGTDIPRLRVCCHLTRVKTELHFRQVLGRVLRVTGGVREEGYLYMPAEPSLVDYANRLAEEIPNENAIATKDQCEENTTLQRVDFCNAEGNIDSIKDASKLALSFGSGTSVGGSIDKGYHSSLAEEYDSTIGIFGRFRHQLINLAACT